MRDARNISTRIKALIQNVTDYFGYELRKKTIGNDVWKIQQQLIGCSNPVIFDLGAHIGIVAQKYRKLFPEARIYCFEPFPASFEILQKNTANDKGVITVNYAVADQTGVASYNSNRSSATNSLLDTDDRGKTYWGDGKLETQERMSVKTTTIDTFCQEYHIPHIHILKMDIQGSELLALAGASKIVAQQAVDLIYMEILLTPVYQNQRKFYEYLQYLDSQQFELFDIFGPVRNLGQLIQIDTIFVQRSFWERQRGK